LGTPSVTAVNRHYLTFKAKIPLSSSFEPLPRIL
jgi:hypothetical protein